MTDDLQTDAAPPRSSSPEREPDYSLDANGAPARLIQACITDARQNTARADRDRQDWRNLLFYRGGDSQWMVWDRGTGRYVERGFDPEHGGLPAYVPRCCTNLFANKIEGICAILTQADPAKEFSPSTEDAEDVASAEVAEDALPVLLDEIGYAEDIKPRATKLIALTDKVFLIPFYDPDPKYGMQIIPDYQCLACQLQVPPEDAEDADGNPLPCPGCGQPLEMAVDHAGAMLGQAKPIGRMRCEIVPSFEGSLPRGSRTADMTQNAWFLSHTRMSVEEIERRWDRARGLQLGERGKGRTGAAGISRVFSDAMAMLSAPSRATNNQGGDGLTDPVVYRLQHDPIVTDTYHFPDGLVVTMVDDVVLEAGPLPVKTSDGRAVKNVVCWQFADAPGTAFGKPPADDLVPIQESRNVVESLIQLILMHDAAPRIFMPLSVTLENEPTGAPGEITYYRSVVPGEKPTMERGMNPPDALYKTIELLDAKMDEVSKLNAVLQGERPTGDPTLGEVQILNERGMSAFRPALDKLVSMEKQLARLLLWIARDSAWSPRFRQMLGDTGDWDLQQFTGADLQGSFDIHIDPATAWPQSPLMQKMQLREAFAMGLFPPPAQDPELAAKVLSLLNLSTLKPSIDLDRKQVGRKLDRWKQASTPQDIAPPDPLTENLQIHFVLLSNYLKTDTFETFAQVNPPCAAAMKQHVSTISQMLAQAAAAAAVQQQPQKPDTRAPADKGDDSALRKAVDGGALKPAANAKPADPMAELMGAGALRPADAAAPPAGPSIDDLIASRALTPVSRTGAEAHGPM